MILKLHSKRTIVSPRDVFKLCSALLKNEDEVDQDKEHCWVLHLTTRFQVKMIELVSLGTLNSTYVEPREVFRRAILNSSACLVIVHNHPSGHPSLSDNDMVVTRRLVQAGCILGIKVIDHVVIGKGYESYREKFGDLDSIGIETS